MKPLKILLLEDLPTDAVLLIRELKKGKIDAETHVVDNKTDFIKSLTEFNPDIILSDHSLSTLDSLEALNIVKDSKLDIPFILVTATVSEEFAVHILNEGADDYILKGNLARLPSSVQKVMQRHSGLRAEEKAKQELFEAHERLIFHLENSPMGYIEWDNTVKVKSMSKRAEEIFGFTEAEFKKSNKTGYSLIYEDDITDSLETGQELVSGTVKSNSRQHRCITKDNRIIWCEWFNSALKDKDGNVTAILSLVQDITERKKSEAETVTLVQNLQTKNKELRQFSYMVSHNLRAPIAKILGLGLLFENASEDMDFCKTLSRNITRETINLDDVVKDINTIVTARDSINLEKEYVLFNKDLNLIKLVLENEIKECMAVITTDFLQADGINTVKSYLYSIIYNLISNAIKYRHIGTPLNIHLQTSVENGFVCLSVKDNGSGIDLDKYGNKIFGLYKRFHGEETPGRGVGLNLVKTQAESLGGRVEVESIINQGSTFKIFLPK